MVRSASAICVLLISVPAMAERDTFPYTAYVTLESSSIRSGPGDGYYPTDRLRRGEAVEVYRHDSSRWAAIRPPRDSFSWVLEEIVERVDGPESIGRIRQSGTKTRVGSNLDHRHRSVTYVTLNEGETVEVLGQEQIDGQRWYRIKPPAGEFRWIRVADLDQSPPTAPESEPLELILAAPETSSDRNASAASIEPQTLQLAQFVDRPPTSDTAQLPAASPSESQGAQASTPARGPGEGFQYSQDRVVSGLPPDGSQPIYGAAPGRPFPANGTPEGGVAYEDGFVPPAVSYGPTGLPPQPTTMIKPGPVAKHLLQSELADVELQLALTVSQPTVAWDMAPLRIRSQAVIDTSDDPELRERATGLLSKIAQFADLQRRQLSVDTEAAQLATMATGPSIMASTYGAGEYYAGSNFGGGSPTGGGIVNPPGVSTAYHYDGTGWLMPVVTERNDMPRYVLTDNSGNIVQFVSASPGLNLKPYVGKQVGIVGQTGRVPDIDQPHLTADRVISLDKVRR